LSPAKIGKAANVRARERRSTNRPQIRISEKKAQLVDIFYMQSVGHPHPRNRHKQIRMAERHSIAFDSSVGDENA